MRISSLTGLEAAESGFTHKMVLTYADLVLLTSGTAYSIYPAYNATTTNANMLVKDCQVYVKTAFVGTGTLLLAVGDGSTAAAYAASTSIKTAGWIVGALTKPAIPAGDIIKITPTAGTDITTFTAGEVQIFFTIVDGDIIA